MALLRQTWTLTSKNILIVLGRHGIATVLRALVLPIFLMAFLSFMRNLFVPPAVYGFSSPHAVRSLADGLAATGGTGRDTVVFVNNGHKGGEIERVIDELAAIVTKAGKTATVLDSDATLSATCRASLRGVTPCYGGVIFNSSPNEGRGGYWNYTLRADSALGLGRINVDVDSNDAQLYTIPLQHAVDSAISSSSKSQTTVNALPSNIDEYPFTPLTQDERADRIRVFYQASIQNWLGVTFFAGMIGISYHLTGFMASERESGMSTLIEAMTFTRRSWEAQAARLLSYHLSFSMLYLPGWLIGSLILWRGVFVHSNGALVLIYHILSGCALASMSIFGSAFFKRSQLSGVTVTIVFLVLAIIAQTISWPRTATVAVLSLLFAPCNYTFFISLIARWEQDLLPTNLTKVAPNSPWKLPGIVLWIFLILQIICYPILAVIVERHLHGTTTSTRNIVVGEKRDALGPDTAVQLEGFTKIYKPGFIRRLFSFVSRPSAPVLAVNGLTLTARRGQILALLGANGSGKSTTLDSIAGINKLSSGNITIDGTGGLGIAPQKNVLWDELTVEEHVRIFNKLKAPNNLATKEENRQLIVSVDLEHKIKAQSRTLSGGQKRKLQLGMMLTGGSAVCCVDEVSSGLDPLSRRKIWDILLAERGQRTIIMTTHFLDEADLLADHIAILSKGTLRAEGSSVELKDRLGAGYRIHVHNAKHFQNTPDIAGVTKKASFEEVTYIATSSSMAATVIKELEAAGISDYRFSGPTIEDVFLQLAEEVRSEDGSGIYQQSAPGSRGTGSGPGSGTGTEKNLSKEAIDGTEQSTKPNLQLLSGKRIGYFRQVGVLFLKRCAIFKHNWFPSVAAFVIPIAAAGLVTLFVRHQSLVGCDPASQNTKNTAVNIFTSNWELFMVGGPKERFSQSTLLRLLTPIYLGSVTNTTGIGSNSSSAAVINPADIFKNLTLVDKFDDFNNMLVQYRKNVTPAAFWLGDDNSRPTFAHKGTGGELINAWFGQWITNMLLANTTIASSFVNFDIPFVPDTGNSLQLLVYMGLALAAYPGFFSLYPNLERRRNVRGLQYSNGVQPTPLWVAYTAFDFSIVLFSSVIVIGLLAGLASLWYHIGYMFLILILYGLASILLAYNISLFAGTQLSAYAFTAASQVFMFLIYLLAYMSSITYAPVNKIDSYLLLVHFVVSAFAPIGSVARALFLVLNLFSTSCDGDQLASDPGSILRYGGPILYLIWQSIFLFLVLIWLDGGNAGAKFKRLFTWWRRAPTAPIEDPTISDEEVANELVRVKSTATATGHERRSIDTDGLRVVNLTKSFGSNTAVDNVTFGIKRGEVFALLGPNGAGKSTTISVIRGDTKPSFRGGDVFVENESVTRHLAAARTHLGVCPQFDAVDVMTVRQHLRFYARVRGIPDIDHNVAAVLRAVGLAAFSDRQAHALSGGNKRKLSLGIALMGNPSVLLLDEPSSGLDAAAKRIMWRTLAATVPGRSILLTTHSMEEADALAGRAGILAKRMLAMGSTEQLRKRFGDALHVHLVCRGAPRTSDEDVRRVRDWVAAAFPSARVEEKTYHGQMRFSVPAGTGVADFGVGIISTTPSHAAGGDEDTIDHAAAPAYEAKSAPLSIGRLVLLLEENKDKVGVEHYSVTTTTLDQVFLEVVGRHNIKEEGYEAPLAKKAWWRFGR